MKSERQQLLLRRMRRSLIALRIQTPQPVLHRIPRYWYFSVMTVLVVLAALISTRAALLFRAEVEATQARVVYVQNANLDRRKVRAAALIDYQQWSKHVEVMREPEPEVVVVKVVKQPVVKRVPVQRASSPEPAPIVISRRDAQPSQPQSIEGAFRRLIRAEDAMALNWLLSRSEGFRHDSAWERFQQAATAVDVPLRTYQIGVLHGALGDDHKAYRWSASAASLSDRPRNIRALAVAADRLGNHEEAARAYRRYLAVASTVDSSQIAERLAVLESP